MTADYSRGGVACAPHGSDRRAVYLFAGPSFWADDPTWRPCIPPGVTLLPPAARGDIPALLGVHGATPPGVLVLADGRFHHGGAAVGHAELRAALEAGWEVWGVASLGALRAWEMRDLGMRGWGVVYESLAAAARAGEDFRDDEVALLYESDPPYRPVSEPLIHLRAALVAWLQPAAAERATAQLEALWFGDRTLARTTVLIADEMGCAEQSVRAALRADFDRFRIKTADLRSLLHERPWESKATSDVNRDAVQYRYGF